MDYSEKKIGIISLGCDKNRVDTEKLLGVLKGKVQITDDIDKANIIIINSCAFLEASRTESLDSVFDANTRRNGALEKVVLTGCLPQKYIKDIFDTLTEVDVFMGVSDYQRIFEALDRAYMGERVNFVGEGKTETQAERVVTTPKSYAYLKIADGCDNFCTYCLIPKIRGRYRSVPKETLLSEAEKLGDVAELILVAQDITRYGEDLYKKQCLAELIKDLTKLSNIGSVRLMYAYPDKLNDDIINEIAENEKVIKYIDMPLQHASDSVLKRMNRRGTGESYLKLIEKLRERIKGIAIRSTFITGFPGESAAEFKELTDFLKMAQLTNAGFFAYSREEETLAYGMPNQISQRIKESRQKRLYETEKAISKRFLKTLVGKTIKVSVDGFDEEALCYKCRAYFSAPDIDGAVYVFSDKPLSIGEKVDVKINNSDDYDLYGDACL